MTPFLCLPGASSCPACPLINGLLRAVTTTSQGAGADRWSCSHQDMPQALGRGWGGRGTALCCPPCGSSAVEEGWAHTRASCGFLPPWAAVLLSLRVLSSGHCSSFPHCENSLEKKKKERNQLTKPNPETIICPLPNLIWEA